MDRSPDQNAFQIWSIWPFMAPVIMRIDSFPFRLVEVRGGRRIEEGSARFAAHSLCSFRPADTGAPRGPRD